MTYFKNLLISSLVAVATLPGCIGTDLIDDLVTSNLTITINPPDDPSLEVGDTLQLTAVVANQLNNSSGEVSLLWTSSRPEVLAVSETGLVTALAEGTAEITAMADDVVSEPYLLAVGEAVIIAPTNTERTGTLEGRGGYTASGTVVLSQNDDGDLMLTTSEDFEVSLALGTFLYLSNSEDGSATANDGLEIADVSEATTGQQTFDVTEIDASVALNTYQYIIVLCKPARLTFGSAEFN